MKIKSIKLKNFKRFTDLKIEGIPEKAKLVVMIGPNGCGKSSVFDALNTYPYMLGMGMGTGDDIDYSDKYYQDVDYYTKSNEFRYSFSHFKSLQQNQEQRMNSYEWDIANSYSPDRIWGDVKVEFDRDIGFPGSYAFDKSIHVRTAYRNSSTLPYTIDRIDFTKERRHGSLIENDEVFSSNYWKLALQWLERSSEIGGNAQKLVELQNEIFGELRDTLSRLFNNPPLVLKNFGNPLDGEIFQFDKGTSKRISFQNLASGEKAALDLLLDVIVTKAEWDETIICIDEPEAHIHTKLQGQLLQELYDLISPKSQLWIATHSIGMVRKAQDLWQDDPDSVVFLDFGKDKLDQDHNFDEEVPIKPIEPNSNFWAQTYDVALGDLAKLVAPKRIILCEGKFEWEAKGFDAACYNRIFGRRYPDTRFISVGNREDIENADKRLIPVIEAIAEGAKILRLRDRDRATCQDKKNNAKEGILILSRKYIEKYLLDDEVLRQLCVSQKKSDKIQEFLTAKDKEIEKVMNDSRIKKKRRPIVQRVQQQTEKILELSYSGDTVGSFMRDILAPLIQPGMKVYEELHKDIFGE